MREFALAAAAAALVVGSTQWVSAQTTAPAAKNAPTKVYSYTQTNPTPKASAPAAARTDYPKAPEHLPSAQRHGTPKWWEETMRSSGGE